MCVACISFGYRFYRCDYCGQRCKRLGYDSPWVDSSGMDDDDTYKPVPFLSAPFPFFRPGLMSRWTSPASWVRRAKLRRKARISPKAS